MDNNMSDREALIEMLRRRLSSLVATGGQYETDSDLAHGIVEAIEYLFNNQTHDLAVAVLDALGETP